MSDDEKSQGTTVAVNRKARFEYTLEDEFEAGLVLTGTEVKSLRTGRANIADAYAGERQGEFWLWNATIPEYAGGNRHNHEPKRARKLLLHKRQMNKLIGRLKNKGVTLVPLSLYFNSRGIAKIKLALAVGKKQYEKRETIKERDWKRQQSRLLKK
jgi:SsrA-binding protein